MASQEFIEAIINDEIEHVRQVIRSGIDPSINDNFAIKEASESGYTELVRLLLSDPRVDPSAFNDYALRRSAENGHAAVVLLLLQDERADPSAVNDYAIRYAAQNGRTEVVQLLLQDVRVNPAATDNHAIRLAAENGHLITVEILLRDRRVDPTANENYALRWAVVRGHVEVVRLLASIPGIILDTIIYYLSKKDWSIRKLAQMTYAVPASETDPDIEKGDLLVWASMFGSVPLVKYLLSTGVDPTFSNNSALAVAIQYQQLAVITYLLRFPSVRNELTDADLKALLTMPEVLQAFVDILVQNDNLIMIKYIAGLTGLLSNDFNNLLVWGASIGSLALVEQFIKMGIDPSFSNNAALKAAIQSEQPAMIDYLFTFPSVQAIAFDTVD